VKPPYLVNMLLGKLPEDNPFGIVAEFKGPGGLLEAAKATRDAGYKCFDVHSPFPVHGMNRAMGLRRSDLPWVILGGGLTGCIGGFALQYWVSAVDYPLVISGKPFNSIPAFIPITFECTILISAFAAVLGMLFFNFLPMLYHPLFKYKHFKRVTTDGFFLTIEARDKKFEPDEAEEFLDSIGGRNIALLEP